MTREENTLMKKLEILYEFTEQGSLCAKEEYARATFLLVKHRIEVLFPEGFQESIRVEPADCSGNEERQETFQRLERRFDVSRELRGY